MQYEAPCFFSHCPWFDGYHINPCESKKKFQELDVTCVGLFFVVEYYSGKNEDFANSRKL